MAETGTVGRALPRSAYPICVGIERRPSVTLSFHRATWPSVEPRPHTSERTGGVYLVHSQVSDSCNREELADRGLVVAKRTRWKACPVAGPLGSVGGTGPGPGTFPGRSPRPTDPTQWPSSAHGVTVGGCIQTVRSMILAHAIQRTN